MQGRKKRINDDFEPVRKKHFFERHPGFKWALIGLAIGLFVAAVALPLIVTIGPGLAPFVAIGTALGLTDALLAGTAGLAAVAGAAMLAFSTVLGCIAAIGSHFRRPRAQELEMSLSASSTKPLLTSTAPSKDDIAKQQAALRNSATSGTMFKSKDESLSGTATLEPDSLKL